MTRFRNLWEGQKQISDEINYDFQSQTKISKINKMFLHRFFKDLYNILK